MNALVGVAAGFAFGLLFTGNVVTACLLFGLVVAASFNKLGV